MGFFFKVLLGVLLWGSSLRFFFDVPLKKGGIVLNVTRQTKLHCLMSIDELSASFVIKDNLF